MSNLSSSPTTGLNPGWNGFEFEVPYCEIPSSLNLVIGAYNVNVTDFDFTGKAFSFKLTDKNDDSKNTSFMNYEVLFYDVNGMRKTARELRKIYPPLAVQLYKVDVLSKHYGYKHQFTTVFVGQEDFTQKRTTNI